MTRFCGVHQHQLILLLVIAMVTAMDSSHSLAGERSSIESTYELTKYLEYQLKEIKDVYLTYLGPPFNEKDFSPPRPNSTALTLPSAATRLELWHGLENQARLAQNQKAYSVLLAAVRELARSTLCPSLKTSLLHFCTGLDGLLGSISALMTTLGYTLPPPSANMRGELQFPRRAVGGERPAPLMSQSLYRSRGGGGTGMDGGQRGGQRRSGAARVADGGGATERRSRKGAGGRSGGSKERGKRRRGKREEPRNGTMGEEEEEEEEEEGVGEDEPESEGGWARRRLLSFGEEEEGPSYPGTMGAPRFSFSLNPQHLTDSLRTEDRFPALLFHQVKQSNMDAASFSSSSSSSSFYHPHRPPRSLLTPTAPPPPLSTLSLLYQFGAGEKHTLLPQPLPLSLQRGTSLLSPPLILSSSSSSSSSSPPSASLLSVRPSMNDFARKVEGFWILRELQSWLWRSAKDFNRLKKRLRG